MKHIFPLREDIIEAEKRIQRYIHKTPIITSQTINKITGSNVYFKCENLQKAGAFKMRGAINAVVSLTEEQKKYGVATHSSGNHAQSLALSAQLHNIKAHIVMPSSAPQVKVNAVREYGAEVTISEPTLEARERTLQEVVLRTNAFFISPYDNSTVIAGQATAAKELLDEMPDLEYILCPVGGGGLLSGCLLACKYFYPKTKVIAGEPENANDTFLSLQNKKKMPPSNVFTIADGLRTSLGNINFEIISHFSPSIITVSEDEIIQAMKTLWERTKLIIESSSSVPFAAVLKQKKLFQNKKIGIILSGGNVDLTKLPF
ncbi:MAG: threonine/serine dehydratase [Chitinophagaceae bacterium]|nr:threonine/serine dehydratase [Chitinophagaceae bacterium]